MIPEQQKQDRRRASRSRRGSLAAAVTAALIAVSELAMSAAPVVAHRSRP